MVGTSPPAARPDLRGRTIPHPMVFLPAGVISALIPEHIPGTTLDFATGKRHVSMRADQKRAEQKMKKNNTSYYTSMEHTQRHTQLAKYYGADPAIARFHPSPLISSSSSR